MGGCMSTPRPISADRLDQPVRMAQPAGSARYTHAYGTHRPDHASSVTTTPKSASPTMPAYHSHLNFKPSDQRRAIISCTEAQDLGSTYRSNDGGAKSAPETGNSYFALPKKSTQSLPPLVQHMRQQQQHGATSPSAHATASPVTSPFLTTDWPPTSPPRKASSTPSGPTVLASAYQGMDDIDILDNPIEHVLPPEPPQTGFGRRLALRSELNNNLMAASPSAQTQMPHLLARVQTAESSTASYAHSKAASSKG